MRRPPHPTAALKWLHGNLLWEFPVLLRVMRVLPGPQIHACTQRPECGVVRSTALPASQNSQTQRRTACAASSSSLEGSEHIKHRHSQQSLLCLLHVRQSSCSLKCRMDKGGVRQAVTAALLAMAAVSLQPMNAAAAATPPQTEASAQADEVTPVWFGNGCFWVSFASCRSQQPSTCTSMSIASMLCPVEADWLHRM